MLWYHEQKTLCETSQAEDVIQKASVVSHRPRNIFNYSHMQITYRNKNTDKCLILGRISLPSSLLLSHLLSQVLHPYENAVRQKCREKKNPKKQQTPGWS